MLGEDTEVDDITFEQMLLLEDQTPVSVVAEVKTPAWWTW